MTLRGFFFLDSPGQRNCERSDASGKNGPSPRDHGELLLSSQRACPRLSSVRINCMRRILVSFFVMATTAMAVDALVLAGGTIWVSPTEKPVRKGSVLIENGRITSVGAVRMPREAQVLDCSRLTILAGFSNSHVHLFERKWENSAKLSPPPD